MAGLSLLACATSEGESETVADPTASTSEESSGSETATETTTDTTVGETETTLGDGDGDPMETEDWGGADYGGSPSCEDQGPVDLALGSNAVDTTQGFNQQITTCGEASGQGNDQLYRFVAGAEGVHTISLANADFEGWLIDADEGFYCYPIEDPECSLPQEGLVIDLSAGETLYLWLDGSDAGTGTLEITEG